MLSKRLKAKLSEVSLDQLEKELKNLAKTLDKSVETSTKELGKKSLEYMKKQYSDNGMSSHIGNIELNPFYKDNYKSGFIISSGNDEIAVYNEFGTGIVGEGTNPLADSAGYEYNVLSVHKGVIPVAAMLMYGEDYCESVNTPNTWWYFKNGRWRHTEGMKGKNMYADLVDELRKSAKKHYDTSIKQAIKDYGGK